MSKVWRANSSCSQHRDVYASQEKHRRVPVLRHLFKTVRDQNNHITSMYSTPPFWRAIGPYLLELLTRQGNELAQITAHDGIALTYRELKEKAIRYSFGLKQLGLRQGEMVAIDGINYHITCLLVIACLMSGYVVFIFDLHTNFAAMAEVLAEKHVKLIVITEDLVHRLKKELDEHKQYKPQIMTNTRSQGYHCAEELESQCRKEEFSKYKPHSTTKLHHTVLVALTNETTVSPKVAKFTHKSIMSLAHMGMFFSSDAYEFDYKRYSQPGSLAVFAIFHLFICVMEMGGIRIMFPEKHVQPVTIMKDVVKYKVEVMPTRVDFWRALSNNPATDKTLKNSSVQTLLVAFDTMPYFMKKKVNEICNDKFLMEIYGMTEATGILCISSWAPGELIPEELNDIKGSLAQGWTLKVVDLQSGKPKGPFETGELYIKSEFMISGYLDTDLDQDFDEEGFFKTGDYGYYDYDNVICVLDRVNNLYRYKDRRLSPKRIERVVMTHPKVKNVCVFGVPHKEYGEVPMAVCEAFETTADEIQEFVAKALPEYYHLKGGVSFLQQIPKTRTGKAHRLKVKELLGMARQE